MFTANILPLAELPAGRFPSEDLPLVAAHIRQVAEVAIPSITAVLASQIIRESTVPPIQQPRLYEAVVEAPPVQHPIHIDGAGTMTQLSDTTTTGTASQALSVKDAQREVANSYPVDQPSARQLVDAWVRGL